MIMIMIFRCCRVLLMVVFALTLFIAVVVVVVCYALAHGLLIGFLLPLSVRPLCCRCRLLFLFCLILLYTHISTGMYEVFVVVVVVVVVSMLWKEGIKAPTVRHFKVIAHDATKVLTSVTLFSLRPLNFQIISFTDKRTVFVSISIILFAESHSLQSTRKSLTSSIKS